MRALLPFILTFILTLTFTPLIHAATPEDYGILDVKNHTISGLPHLAGDGTTDETSNLQKIVDYAYENQYIVIFPAGEYLVSNTIDMMDRGPYGYSNTHAFQLIGSTQGQRPTIILKANSPGFNNPSQPKPILKLWRKCGSDPRETQNKQECAANFFNSGVRNLDITVRSGNTGAVGIYHNAHQQSFLESITIDMTASGFAGITATPGMGDSIVGDIELIGGDYGINVGESNHPTITDITFTNQKIAAIRAQTFFAVSVAGFKITKAEAPVIQVGRSTDIGTVLTLTDGSITVNSDNGQPLIANNDQNTVSLINVYTQGSTKLIRNAESTVDLPSTTSHIGEYMVASQYSSQPGIIIDGQSRNTSDYSHQITAIQASPIDPLLTQYHAWCYQQLSADHLLTLSQDAASGVCNARDHGVQNRQDFDSQPALQALLNSPDCHTVWLPSGDYYLGDTLTLPAHIQFHGNGTPFTFLNATDNFKPTSPTPLIATVDDPDAAIFFTDMHIAMPAEAARDWFHSLYWQAGKLSVIKNINTNPSWARDFGSTPKTDVIFTHNAGGKWFGAMSAAVEEQNSHPDRKRLQVLGTTQPLYFYNYNIEDGFACDKVGENNNNGCPTDSWQTTVENAQNLSIIGAKYEQWKSLKVENSSNILYLGSSRGNETQFINSNNVLVAGIKHDQGRDGGLMVREDFNGQTTTINRDSAVGVLKRGQIDRSSNFISCDMYPTPQVNPTGHTHVNLIDWVESIVLRIDNFKLLLTEWR